jgi:tritrans,polycis-undecaprenyl-diphosphate synthase [geranylgeranyl-diphosphate specific]
MHVAIIPDGNRRYAKKENISLEEAYKKGIEKIKELLQWFEGTDVKELTIWGFSTENFKRDEKEKNTIWNILNENLSKLIEEYKKSTDERKKQARINFFGNLNLLPEQIRGKAQELMYLTKYNNPYSLNILLAYGGKYELLDAINKAVKEKLNNKNEILIGKEDIEKHLMVKSAADLIIRTGNEKRLSGYLLWQSEYSELFFSEKLWPEFTRDDFNMALNDYYSRERRFGR